ncbi:hypothetical protein C2S51_006665 [Perilla frutescens var. frutescens]|nr:hypothetical protein C2S51_006665 [Perilla frutescens var. frutescens]
MALQLILIFLFVSLLLPPALSTGLIAKPECQDQCGKLKVPYPFGVGSDCSLNSSFTISCNNSTNPPKAYLSTINIEVIEINETYIRVKYPILSSVCYDLSSGTGMNVTAAASYTHSTPVNLSGTPYTLSMRNRLTTLGCDDVVLQSNGSWVSGGCSAICADKNDTGGVGYCPYNETSLGNGCCQALISEDASFRRTQLIDLSGKLLRRKLFPCSYAFLQEPEESINTTVFSYPLYYLDNSTALLDDNWASSTRPPVVRLDWSFGDENCSQAMLNSSTYACRDEKSVCGDYYRTGGGYLCRCVQGYEGNPYLRGGCKPISFSSSIAKYGCPDQCGELSIPYPFGVGKNCYLAPSFEITCNASTNPPIAYLAVFNAQIIELNSSQVLVFYPTQLVSLACYDLSDNQRGMSKTDNRRMIIDLSRTQYTLSDENWITTIGCGDMMVAITRQANRSFIVSSCAAVCWDTQFFSNTEGYCPSGTTMYRPGDGCCRAPIPRGTTYLEANLTDLSWPRMNFSCSYAFIDYKHYSDSSYEILNNSTAILARNGEPTALSLEWRIGAEKCYQARQNLTTYACQTNSDCVDFDTNVAGYLCNCSTGYKGNPYLIPGCQGW